MQIKDEIEEVLHRIRAKLYPNRLRHVEGKYIARTESEEVLNVRKVCGTAISRGGVKLALDDFVDCVNKYNAEVAYQLCDGYAVSNEYFSIHPVIGGVFNSEKDIHDHARHPLSFRFRILSGMRRLLRFIKVDINGVAETGGHIAEFTDLEKGLTNEVFVPGGQFSISGRKIKIAGGDPACGVYLAPVDDPSKKVKIARIAQNTRTKIAGVLPSTTGLSACRIEIVTQYAGAANNFLKTPRVIRSDFTIEEA